jgi:small GTP-binding protein
MSLLQKKVCLLGDFAVGKTSLVRRFIEGIFDDKYLSTIGAKVDRKTLRLETNGDAAELSMLIWDLAGGEKFDRVMSSYYRGAAGAVLVCDLTRAETLSSLTRYINDFWGINPHTPLVMVGNKADLVEQQVITPANLAAVAGEYRLPWFTSSAKTGENVEALFATLGRQLLVTK